jgi:hypothetical protein
MGAMACWGSGHKEVGKRVRVATQGKAHGEGTYQSKARVEALSEDGVARLEDKLGEQDLVTSLVDLWG